MKKCYLITSLFAACALLAGACSPQPAPTPAGGSSSSVPVAGATAAGSSSAAASAAALPGATPTTGAGLATNTALIVGTSNARLGTILTDKQGMSLYLYTKDVPKTSSSCYDKCAITWPPLLTGSAPFAGPGADAGKLGTITRTDGTTQVTYNGWPLYYYAGDGQPGDIAGQAFEDSWFVVSTTGEKITFGEHATPTVQAAAAAGPATVAIGSDGKLGSILVDGKGQTLYMYTLDTPNTSNCYAQCEHYWPPLLTLGKPVAGQGVDPAKFGTTQRKDGSMQVTYNGWPLYYYLDDLKPGDTAGQGYGSQWYVLSPAGQAIGQ